jgi:hypothetical protein
VVKSIRVGDIHYNFLSRQKIVYTTVVRQPFQLARCGCTLRVTPQTSYSPEYITPTHTKSMKYHIQRYGNTTTKCGGTTKKNMFVCRLKGNDFQTNMKTKCQRKQPQEILKHLNVLMIEKRTGHYFHELNTQVRKFFYIF